jgi:hypothetical protein
MRTKKEYLKAQQLKNQGLNNSEISKILNIPRPTISGWFNTKLKLRKKDVYTLNPKNFIIENNLQNTYSYILGLYLGDGYINKIKNSYRLRIFNTVEYKLLNKFIINQLGLLFPNNKIGYTDFKTYLSICVYSNKSIPFLFPQHGKGRKHKRKIYLHNWQKEIISDKYLLMGLFHSDGCFYYRKVNSIIYPAYCFINESNDIHKIFQNCCDKLNVKYTYALKPKRTNIYKKNDVECLLTLIGTKSEITS